MLRILLNKEIYMTYDYMNDPKVCISSLGEDGKPVDGVGAHRWDDSVIPNLCAECGAMREEVKCICACGNEHMRYED